MAKYQVMFLYLPLALYLLVCERKQFCKFGLYLAGIIAIIVILPHWIWLYNTDFFSFNYIMARTTPDIGNTPISLVKFGHIIFPLKFWGDQLLALLPCFVVYLFLALKEKNISININKENLSEKIFLLFVGLMPIFVLGAMGFLTGNRVVGNWGSTMVGFCGILLFYFFPIKFYVRSTDAPRRTPAGPPRCQIPGERPPSAPQHPDWMPDARRSGTHSAPENPEARRRAVSFLPWKIHFDL